MLLVKLKLGASPLFFYYGLCWFFKLNYLNGRVTISAGQNVFFPLRAGIQFRLNRQKSE
jgi:hypothetical protein